MVLIPVLGEAPTDRQAPPRGTMTERSDSVAHHLLTADHSPEAMTRRARWYLSVACGRHLTLGVFVIAAPALFQSLAFQFLGVDVMYWGLLMIGVALLCFLAAWLRSGTWARWAMGTSAVLTLVLAGGTWIGISVIWWEWLNHMRDIPASPIIPILLTAISAKDFVVCAQPIRSPFESVIQQIVGD